jgi:rubrerythrin
VTGRGSGVQVSVWAQHLAAHLDDHMDNEREALRAYREMAGRADDRVGLLVTQILDDEIRHHQQFAELRDALRSEVEGRGRNGRAKTMKASDLDALLAQTDTLLALEKADLKELRRLAKTLRQVEDTAWRAVIVESMELDTRKHVRLLEGIRSLLEEARRRRDALAGAR